MSTYREQDKLIPIVERLPAYERLDPSRLNDRLVDSAMTQTCGPITQVIDRVDKLSEDAKDSSSQSLAHFNCASVTRSYLVHNSDYAYKRIKSRIEAIEIPANFTKWNGEENSETSRNAQIALNSSNYRSVC